jgi:hypothetical protein
MRKVYVIILCCLSVSVSVQAQQDSTDIFDYSKFGDAEGVKRFCTQKVLNQTPLRVVSIGYEQHGSFTMPDVRFSNARPETQTYSVNRVSALRFQVNVPVISTNRFIWQLGASYWGSRFSIENPGTNLFAKSLNENTMTSAGINTTIFKPLDEKRFLIIQGSLDANGVFQRISDVTSQAYTFSGALIYGWKKSEKNMIGTGIARTYRAGQMIHLPVLFWNKTFNDHWGMELLLPARGHLRYNFSTSNILQLGFELEGNQFLMDLPNSKNGTVFIQRSELKPRIMWDKKISGFFWLSAQAGLRYNWRFDVMDSYNARNKSQLYFSSQLGNPLYFNISINFVSP